MGATESTAAELMEIGYEAWIDTQLQTPASLQLPALQALPIPKRFIPLNANRIDAWTRNALHGNDQLRQRVAFALSEIFVVSEASILQSRPYALASYYDLLAEHAFSNYRELMEHVTLHPAMGIYLSMLGNRKPEPESNIFPDENYARELMQLFTIGLEELEPDGTPTLDARGRSIPTYDQEIVEGFAHVFTGWHFAGAESFQRARNSVERQVVPMELYPDFHDTGPKRLLRGVTLPAGQDGDKDLADALDNLFHHPNVGPFVSKRLIQRLVTSNPSREYVARIAATFDDNGNGTRGDLAAVIKAILLDTEARQARGTSEHAGKLKEPLLRLTQLWRAYDGQPADTLYTPRNFYRNHLGQGPLQAPSVFNFFSPTYQPPGEMANAGLVSPESELATEYLSAHFTQLMYSQCFRGHGGPNSADSTPVIIDISEEIDIAEDVAALVDRVAHKLLGGDISIDLRTEAETLADGVSDPATRVAAVLFLVAISPEFALQA